MVVNIFIRPAIDEDVVNKKGGSFPKNPKEQKYCRHYIYKGAQNNRELFMLNGKCADVH